MRGETRMQEKEAEKILDVFLLTYNRADYLKESIQSVLSQSYQDFELTVLDNCSTDETEEVVRSFNDERLHYVRHSKNIGAWGNICYAYERSEKKYFVIFHDDDIMLEDFLKTELEAMEKNPDISIISCKSGTMDKNSKVDVSTVKPGSGQISRYCGHQLFEAYINKRTYIGFPTIMYRAEFMRKKQIRFSPEAGPSADILFCMDVERFGGVVAILDRYLTCYRKHSGQDSQLSRREMVYKLFFYMKKNPYYETKLKKNRTGQGKYYKKLIYNELCLFASEKIGRKELWEDKKAYEEVLDVPKGIKVAVSIIVGACSGFPFVLRLFYRKGKIIKKKFAQ